MKKETQNYHKIEALQALAGGIVHDFNNILAGIIGYVDLALDDTKPGTDLHLSLSRVMTDARRGADLVREILAFSHDRQDERKSIQLRQLLKAVIKRLRPLLPDAIEVHQDISSETLLAICDTTQIYIVITGLYIRVANVLGKTGGTVTVILDKTTFKNNQIENGLKISAGNYVHLALNMKNNPPHQNKKSRPISFAETFKKDANDKGAGISFLALEQIVQDHSGGLNVEPVSQHETTVHLYLPRHEAPGVIPAQHAKASVSSQGEKILVVDDEPHAVDVVCRMLKNLGYVPTGFVDSRLALAELTRHPHKYDLMLTDYNMPYVSGAELTKKARKLCPDMKLILFSGVDPQTLDRCAKELKIEITFGKPFVQNIVAAAVTKALAL
jgi:CheY-like chemotaxis protein